MIEDCAFLAPEGRPLGLGLQRLRSRRGRGWRLATWVWNDEDGPTLAIHCERNGRRVKHYTWTRFHGLEPLPAEARAQARKSHSQRSLAEVEAELLKLTSFIA